MKNSLPSALVLGFVSLAWGEESLRAKPVRSPTELPPSSEPPPPQACPAPWSFAALHLAPQPAPEAPPRTSEALREAAQTRLADKQRELEQLQSEINSLEQHRAAAAAKPRPT